jgi:hypothetical protein
MQNLLNDDDQLIDDGLSALGVEVLPEGCREAGHSKQYSLRRRPSAKLTMQSGAPYGAGHVDGIQKGRRWIFVRYFHPQSPAASLMPWLPFPAMFADTFKHLQAT